MHRTAVVNQIRGLLLERGITVRKGRCHLDGVLPGLLEDASINLSGTVRLLLAQLKLELDQLATRLEEADALVQKTAQESEVCRRLDAIPGIGPLTATAQVAAHADRAIELRIHQRAAIETVRAQRAVGFALRAMIWPITIRVGNLIEVLLDRAREGV